MHAIAILGPNAAERDVDAFRLPGVEITTAQQPGGSDAPDAVLIFGGDGTVHRQLADLVERRVPLLTIPRGSGNDFAHALGIRRKAGALAAWKMFCRNGQNVRWIDLGLIATRAREQNEAGNRLFCCSAGAGLDSEANRRANAMPRWLRAHGGYAVGVVSALARFRPQLMRLQCWDATGNVRGVEGTATMVAIGNAPSYGRGMRIVPRAKLDDRLLDVCFVRQVGKFRLLRFFPRVYSGSHLGMSEVEYAQAARVTLETESPTEVYADGEYICRTPVEIRVVPMALKVIVPAGEIIRAEQRYARLALLRNFEGYGGSGGNLLSGGRGLVKHDSCASGAGSGGGSVAGSRLDGIGSGLYVPEPETGIF